MAYRPPKLSDIQPRQTQGQRTYGEHLTQKPFQTRYPVQPIPTRRGPMRYMDMRLAYLLSLLTHILAPVVVITSLFALMLLGLLDLDLLKQQAKPKPADLEFVLAPQQTPVQKPLDTNTRFRAEQDMKAGGPHDPTKHVNLAKATAAAKPSTNQAQPNIVMKPKPVTEPPKKALQAPKQEKPKPKPTVSAPVALAKPSPISNEPIVKNTDTTSSTPTSSAMPVIDMAGLSGLQSAPSSQSVASNSELANGGAGNKNGPLGVDAIREPDFGPYMKELQRRIKQSWRPPRGNHSKRVVLFFRVTRSGSLKEVSVSKSSGEASTDEAAIQAIRHIFPFRPLPPEFTEEDIGIEFTFDYNVFGEQDKLGRYHPG